MDTKPSVRIARRELLRVVASGVGVAVIAAVPIRGEAALETPKDRGKRKAQYQANSPEVQNFYRVNRYPQK